MKKRLFVRRPATAEEMQWARDHCCEECGVNAAISVEKVIKHHDRDSVTETIDLLLITSNGEVLQVRNLSPAELTAAVMQRTVGFSSGVCFNPTSFNNSIIPLVEKQILDRSISVEDQYHFSGRDPEKVQYVCRDGTLLAPLNSITPEDLIKVPNGVSIFKLLGYLIRVVPNYIAIYILALRALASMLSSPALEGKSKPSFGIILLGETGSKKTSLVKALFYMDEHPYNAVNFKWTPAAVQEKLKDVQDDIVLADDMYPAKITSEKNQQREMLSLLIRATGDDIGSRQKMQGGTVTTGKASSLFIATAEQLIPCSESDIWRTFILNICKDDVDKDALSWIQGHPDVIRFYSRLFIQCFTLSDERVAKLYKGYINNRTCLRDRKPELPDRLVSNCAWLEAAILVIDDFLNEISSVQSLTEEDCTIWTNWDECYRPNSLRNIETIITHQYGRYSSGGDTDTATFTQIMDVIKAMRDDGVPLFIPLAKGERGVQIARTPDKALAFYWPNDDSYVYLQTDMLMEAVGEYCRGHGNIDFTAPSGKTFRSMLVQNGLFVRQQHGKNRTKELSVNGTRYKVTVVFRDELEKWIGPMEQE